MSKTTREPWWEKATSIIDDSDNLPDIIPKSERPLFDFFQQLYHNPNYFSIITNSVAFLSAVTIIKTYSYRIAI